MTGIPTAWCVVTGAPCSGKTTVLQDLEKRGFRFIPEVARVYIEEQLAKGKMLQEIRANEGQFQMSLIQTKIRIENGLPTNEVVFLDRAMPDSITYFRTAGLDPFNIIDVCKRYRYQHIFILDRLPFIYDHARIENEATVDFLDHQLERDYQDLGYKVIRVPVMSVFERSEFIIGHIGDTG